MKEDSQLSRLFSKCLPISIAITAYDGDNSAQVWLGDHSPGETSEIVDVDYINRLMAGKDPDDIYDATLRIPNLDAVTVDNGYRFRFQTKTWWQLEEFLAALSKA